MIPFEKAIELITRDVPPPGTHRRPAADALFYVLAEDIYSDVDMPPFDKAAMDGYACRREDLARGMKMTGSLAAGDIPGKPVGLGECMKIMTGAMVPDGADVVIMVEHTRQAEDGLIYFTAEKTAGNIAFKAEDLNKGDRVWQGGQMILPQHLAMFAAVGYTHALVYNRPSVGILSTGDELVEPGQIPGPGKIRNSNASQLMAQARAAHADSYYLGIVPDQEESTRKAIGQAMENHDLVLLTGGVSMGDYDFVPRVMKECGIEIVFQKVEIKPGRPTVYGRKANRHIFGLPGNPVSSFINFEVMVRPLLALLAGGRHEPLELLLPLASQFKRKKADRPEWLPVAIVNNKLVKPVAYHGSAHIHALSHAQGLMFIPKNVYSLNQGDIVHVRPI